MASSLPSSVLEMYERLQSLAIAVVVHALAAVLLLPAWPERVGPLDTHLWCAAEAAPETADAALAAPRPCLPAHLLERLLPLGPRTLALAALALVPV